MLETIERLLLKEFQTVPFHNLFMLNDKKVVGSKLGGTCSDKVLHFKAVLQKTGINTRLCSSFIKGHDCHRLLSVNINRQSYFIDVGSGWPSIKLIPAFKPSVYEVFGMAFKTQILEDKLLLFHKAKTDFSLMTTIPLNQKPEHQIRVDIRSRFENKSIYPFQNKLRFSKVIGSQFCFLKNDKLRIYTKESYSEHLIAKEEIAECIQQFFNFDLKGMNCNLLLNQNFKS